MNNKPNSLTVPKNIFGHRVTTNRALEGVNAPKCDIGYKTVIVKEVTEAHAEYLIKKLIAQYKREGCTLDEVDQGNSAGSVIIELSSSKRDVVIIHRPAKSKLSLSVHYRA